MCPRISFEYLKLSWHLKILAASSNSGVACVELILQKTITNSGQNTKTSQLSEGTGEWPLTGRNWRGVNTWKERIKLHKWKWDFVASGTARNVKGN